MLQLQLEVGQLPEVAEPPHEAQPVAEVVELLPEVHQAAAEAAEQLPEVARAVEVVGELLHVVAPAAVVEVAQEVVVLHQEVKAVEEAAEAGK